MSVGASTVRQAAQTFAYGFTGVVFATIFGFQALPASRRITLQQALTGPSMVQTAMIVGLTLVVLDLVVLAIARHRFQRARLILD